MILRLQEESQYPYTATVKNLTFLIEAMESYCSLEHWRVMRKVLGPDYESTIRSFKALKVFEIYNGFIPLFVNKLREFDEKYEPLKTV